MGFIIAAFAAIIISLTTAGPAIDPDPYDEVTVYRTWRDIDGRHLACCILGQSGDERGRTLAVFDSTAVGWRRLFLDSDRGFRPWALELAELDGDPLPEVVVGAHKATRFDPVVCNRIFVYDLTAEGGLYAKWLGSKLGGTPSRFFVRPGPDGRDRLHCVEEGRPEITHRYRWHGFGFTWEAGVASEGTS
jgi:hypothetical protein